MRYMIMVKDELQAGYEDMARESQHEAEAIEWCEALIADVPFDDTEG